MGLATERKSVKVNGTGGCRRPCPAQLQCMACVLNDGARFEDRVGRAARLPTEWKGVRRSRLSRDAHERDQLLGRLVGTNTNRTGNVRVTIHGWHVRLNIVSTMHSVDWISSTDLQ